MNSSATDDGDNGNVVSNVLNLSFFSVCGEGVCIYVCMCVCVVECIDYEYK